MSDIVCDADSDLVHMLRQYIKSKDSDKSEIFVDIDKAMTNPKILRLLHKNIINRMILDQISVDYFACLESGILTIVGLLSTETGIPLIIINNEKGKGTSNIIGNYTKGKNVLFLAEVATEKSLNAISALIKEGMIVDKILTIFDKEEADLSTLNVQLVPLIELSKFS